jgi:anti-anti-sigma factor
MAKSLDIKIVWGGPGAATVHVDGRVDGETCGEFDRLVKPLVEKRVTRVLVDMTKCHYVSSAGIRSFFDLRKQVQSRQGVLSFANLQPQIKKVFEIVKALPLECVFSNVAEADAYLDRMMAEELKKASSKK